MPGRQPDNRQRITFGPGTNIVHTYEQCEFEKRVRAALNEEALRQLRDEPPQMGDHEVI